jgi:uncharacterized protein (DUF2164 family)
LVRIVGRYFVSKKREMVEEFQAEKLLEFIDS